MTIPNNPLAPPPSTADSASTDETRHAASFRDPSGFIFERDGRLFRQVNRSYAADYDLLMASGLYEKLARAGSIIPHQEVAEAPAEPDLAYKVIEPERLEFVSYPYEWSFSELKDAALLTLAVQKRAMKAGLALKDASAYNIQFVRGKATLIDTLSFARYREGEPWIAYRQFCEHFLAPLAACGLVDPRLGRTFVAQLDGIPLDLASALLPGRSWLMPGLVMHLHLHARFQRGFGATPDAAGRTRVSRMGMLALIDSLERAIASIRWRPSATAWTGYDADDAGGDYRARKLAAVQGCIAGRSLPLVYDLGANLGRFSRAAASGQGVVVAADADAAVVDASYRACREEGNRDLLPLVVDLVNPGPGIGWNNEERVPFLQRARPDLVMALALVHHLAIGNNLPLARIARMFRALCAELVVEFVPPSDSQAMRLLAARRGAVHEYSQAKFEDAFGACYGAARVQALSASGRTLYHYRVGG